jgi:hypothetical protein
MRHRTTPAVPRVGDRPTRASRSHRPPPTVGRRPQLFAGVAAAGALLAYLFLGADPAAQADAASHSVSVSDQLGLTSQSGPADMHQDVASLGDLAASRATREADESAAVRAQAAADQRAQEAKAALAASRAELARRKEAAAAAAKAKAQAHAQAQAQATQQADQAAAAPAAALPDVVAQITNSAGSVHANVQAAANVLVSNVPGVAGLTLGGTRASATDPTGHPSGNALDYMVLTNSGLGDAIVQYHIAHWAELHVEYIIWQQRILQSPGGSWSFMADRGSPTANHMDHVHVNYLP